jgi:hypothetical protein
MTEFFDGHERAAPRSPLERVRPRLPPDRSGPDFVARTSQLTGHAGPSNVGNSRPLPADVLRDARLSFGRDFSAVRVHTDAAANESAADLGAKAYAMGQHIVFGPGRFRPTEPTGRRLIGHELAHVAQQLAAVPNGGDLEAEAAHAADRFAQGRRVVLTGRSAPAIACDPEDPEHKEEEQYQAERAEDIRAGRNKPGAKPARTRVSPARQAERDVTRMMDDAKTGRYRSASIKTKGQLVARFRRVLRTYRQNEMANIDRALGSGEVSPTVRRGVISRKQSIVADRSYLQGKFDEAVRTPQGPNVDVQPVHVRGGTAHPYHETTPGKGSYTQPDYDITGASEVGGRTRLHVNLKSHDMTRLTAADARAIARDVRDQAVANAFGKPTRRGDVGHLPAGEDVVISFSDKPPREIQSRRPKCSRDRLSVRPRAYERRGPEYRGPAASLCVDSGRLLLGA